MLIYIRENMFDFVVNFDVRFSVKIINNENSQLEN